MKQLVVDYPDDLERATRLSESQFAAHVKLMAALKMFEVGELSSGKAAEFAGISRVDFIEACGHYGVSSYNVPSSEISTELISDLAAAERVAR